MKDYRVLWMALLLSSIGIGLTIYKSQRLNIPLRADQQTSVWTVEARASFQASGKVLARLVLPSHTPGFEIINEDFVSRDFGLALNTSDADRMAVWSIRKARGVQSLYYRVSLNPAVSTEAVDSAFPGYPAKPDYPELTRTAIESLLETARQQSVDIASFTGQLIRHLNRADASPEVAMLRGEARSEAQWVRQLVHVLAGARIPARVVYGLPLVHGVLDARLVPWLEVHNEQRWIAFNPRTGEAGFPDNFLVWKTGEQPALEVDGAAQPELRFSIRRTQRQTLELAREHAASPLINASLLGLPLYVQNVYTILLTVPLGAFLVVLLRNLIGFKTFGTFMPILIALSFRETQLIWGLSLFILLVSLGLALRFVLEHLKLLLVPRLTAVLIIVILLMLAVSIASYRMGFDHGLSVALFPMVILAMTIERMSITWEEHGARDAILRGLGSLAVATAAFMVMSQQDLQYLVGIFPELLLVVLALTLLMGRYTGYRLSEIWRFRAVWMKP